MKIHPTLLLSGILTSGPACADVIEVAPTDDSYIRASQPNQGVNNLAIIGDTANPDDFLRALFAFDLNAPQLAGATIHSVSLRLTVTGRDSASGGSADLTQTLELHQLAASFTNDGVTWTSRNGTDDWITPGADFGPPIASLEANAGTINQGDTLTFSSPELTSIVSSLIGESVGLLGKLAVEDAERSVFRIASENNDTLAFRPRLVIDFTPAEGSADPASPPSPALRTAC